MLDPKVTVRLAQGKQLPALTDAQRTYEPYKIQPTDIQDVYMVGYVYEQECVVRSGHAYSS